MWNLRHLSACVRPRRGRNTKLLLSALMAVTLPNAAQAARSTICNDTGPFFVVRCFANGGDFDCFGGGGRGAGSQRLGDLLRCFRSRAARMRPS